MDTPPPRLLIHGSPANGDVWSKVTEAFSNGPRNLTPTLLGHSEIQSAEAVEANIGDLAAALERQVGDNQVDILAHSFGGVIALRLALRGTLKIRRIMLLEPVVLPVLKLTGESERYEIARRTFDEYARHYQEGEKYAVSRLIDFWFGAGAFECFPDPIKSYMEAQTAINLRDIQATMREPYDTAGLQALEMPIKIVYGTNSPQTTMRIASALCRLLGNATMTELSDANHAMVTTHPSQIAHLAETYFKI